MTSDLKPAASNEIKWYWGEAKKRVFPQLKVLFISPEALTHYGSTHSTVIAADASFLD